MFRPPCICLLLRVRFSKRESTHCAKSEHKKVGFQFCNNMGAATKIDFLHIWHWFWISELRPNEKLLNKSTVFKNHPKCRIWNFSILAFSTNVCPIKKWPTYLVTLFDRKLQVFKNSPKFTIFYEVLSTQSITVACLARNVERDFFWFLNTVQECYYPQGLCGLITQFVKVCEKSEDEDLWW